VTILSLRRARKAKARAAADAQGTENRLRSGTPEAARIQAAATRELEDRRLEAHRRASPAEPDRQDGE
jgi:hypothetical protein